MYFCYQHDPDEDTTDVSKYVSRKGLHFIAPLHIVKDTIVLFQYGRDMTEDMLTGFFKTANTYNLSLLLVYTQSYDAYYHKECHISMKNIHNYLPALDVSAHRRLVFQNNEDFAPAEKVDDFVVQNNEDYTPAEQDDDFVVQNNEDYTPAEQDDDFVVQNNEDFTPAEQDDDYHPDDADNFLPDMETVFPDETDSDVDISVQESCYNPFCSHYYDEQTECEGCGKEDYPYELLHDKFMYQSMDEGFVSLNSYVQLYFKCNSTVKSKERVPNILMFMRLFGIPYTSYISIIKKGTGSLVHYYEFDDWMDIIPIFIESLSSYGDEFIVTFLCKEEVRALKKLKRYTPKMQEKLHNNYAKRINKHLHDVGNAYYLQKQVVLPITSDVFMSPIFENVDETLQTFSEEEKWGNYMTHVLENYLVADSLSESKLVHAYYPWMKQVQFLTFIDQVSEDDDSDFELE